MKNSIIAAPKESVDDRSLSRVSIRRSIRRSCYSSYCTLTFLINKKDLDIKTQVRSFNFMV